MNCSLNVFVTMSKVISLATCFNLDKCNNIVLVQSEEGNFQKEILSFETEINFYWPLLFTFHFALEQTFFSFKE